MFNDAELYKYPPFNPNRTDPIWNRDSDYVVPVVSSVGNGPKGDKGDPLVFDDLTDEQMQKILHDASYVGNECIEATYRTIGNNTTTIEIPIADYDQFDMLFVDIEGLDLHEGADYTIVSDNIILNVPITHPNTKVHFRAIRYTTLDGNKRIVNEMGHKDYNSAKNMKLDEELKAGDICHTLGWATAGDNGAAWYIITDDANPNDTDILALDNGYFALMMPEDSSVRPEQLGALNFTVVNWNGPGQTYSKRTVVKNDNMVYTARQDVYTGVQIENQSYWVPWNSEDDMRLILGDHEERIVNLEDDVIDLNNADKDLQNQINEIIASPIVDELNLNYEGLITQNISGLMPMSCAFIDDETLLIICADSSDNNETVVKVHVTDGKNNKVISIDSITDTNHANSCCIYDGKLYVVAGITYINVYDVNSLVLERTINTSLTAISRICNTPEGVFYLIDNNGYNYDLYEFDTTDGTCTLVNDSIYPYYSKCPALRNDCFYYDGSIYSILFTNTHIDSPNLYSFIHRYNIKTEESSIINVPSKVYGFFACEEWEGLAINNEGTVILVGQDNTFAQYGKKSFLIASGSLFLEKNNDPKNYNPDRVFNISFGDAVLDTTTIFRNGSDANYALPGFLPIAVKAFNYYGSNEIQMKTNITIDYEYYSTLPFSIRLDNKTLTINNILTLAAPTHMRTGLISPSSTGSIVTICKTGTFNVESVDFGGISLTVGRAWTGMRDCSGFGGLTNNGSADMVKQYTT